MILTFDQIFRNLLRFRYVGQLSFRSKSQKCVRVTLELGEKCSTHCYRINFMYFFPKISAQKFKKHFQIITFFDKKIAFAPVCSSDSSAYLMLNQVGSIALCNHGTQNISLTDLYDSTSTSHAVERQRDLQVCSLSIGFMLLIYG